MSEAVPSSSCVLPGNFTEADVVAQPGGMMLVNSPPDDVEEISRHLMSSLKQHNGQDTSSDSGDSLFITQKCVPQRRRRSSRRSNFRDSPEDEYDASTSEEEHPEDTKQKKKSCTTPKFTFDFLEERMTMLSYYQNRKLHYYAMGGYFRCAEQLWDGYQTGKDLLASLPTADEDGEPISPISEEKDETTENEDIRVVEKKLFVVSKTKNSQPWYNPRKGSSEETQQNEEHYNAGREPQGRPGRVMHKISTWIEGAEGHQPDPSSNLIITEAVEAPRIEEKNKKNHEEQETWIPSLRGVSSSKTKESNEISEEMESVEEQLSTSGSHVAETEMEKNSRSPGKESRASDLIPEDNEQMLGNESDATCGGVSAEQSDREATDPHTGVDEHTGVENSEIDCRIIKVKKRKKIKKEGEGDKYVEEGKDQSLEGAGDHQTDPSSNLIITEAVETPCMEKKKKKKKKNKREEETWIPSLRGVSSSKTKESSEISEEMDSVEERLSTSGSLLAETETGKNSRSPGKESRASDLIPEDNEQMLGNERDATCHGTIAEQSVREATDPHTGVDEHTGVENSEIDCRIIKVKKRKKIKKEGEGDKYVEEGKDQSLEGAGDHQTDPSSNLIITEAVETPCMEKKKKKKKKNKREVETWIPSLRGVSSSKTKESSEISEEMDSVEERLSTSGSLLAETETGKNSRSPGKESRASDLIPEDNEQMLGNERDATCHGTIAEQSVREATDPHTGVDEHTGVENSEIDCRIIKVKKRKKIKKEGEGDKYVEEGKDQSLEGAGDHQTDPSSNLIITEAVETPCMEKKKKKKKKNKREVETWIPSLRGVSSSKTKESNEVLEETKLVDERLSMSGANEQTGVQYKVIECRIIKVKKRKKINKEGEGDKYVEEGKDQSLEGAGGHQPDPSSNLIITEELEAPCMEKKKKKKKKKKRENQYLGQETDEQSEQSDQRKEDFVVMCENGNIVTDSLKTNKAVESATNDMHVPKNRKKKKKDSSDLDETTTDHPEAIDRSRNGEVFQEMLESSGFRRKKHKKKKSQSPNDIQTDVDLSNDVSTVPQNTDFVYKKKKHVNDQVGLAEEDESVEKTPKEKQNIEQETKKKKKKIKDDISVSNSEDMLAYGDYSQLVRKNKKKRTHSVLSAEDEEPSPSAREGRAEKPEVSAGELAAKSADVSEHLQESKDGKKKRKRSATVPESEEKELEETSEAPVKNKEKRKRTKKLMETLESVEQFQTEEAVIVKKTKKRKSRREVLEKESH